MIMSFLMRIVPRPPKMVALTAAEVDQLVKESREDVNECLISPIWGATNPQGTLRHLGRFGRVLGITTQGAVYGKMFMGSIGMFFTMFAILSFQPDMGYILDFCFALAFGCLTGAISIGYIAYKAAFARINVNEHRDFTDPGQVTSRLRAWTARLSHYYSTAWRGANDSNGVSNPDSALYYKTDDVPIWIPEGEEHRCPDGSIIEGPKFIVYPARKVVEFREMDDYLHLEPEVFLIGGNSARDRRATRQTFNKPADGMERYVRGKATVLQDNFLWIYSIICIVAGFFISAFALG